MAQQSVSVGAAPNDGTGDALRAAFVKLNANDAELYAGLAGKQASLTLTTSGTSGAATLVGGTLNIPQYGGGGSVTPAALTKADDTNVTLTLGGAPGTALLQATSVTVGWSGTLSVARGGTGSGTAAGARTNLGLVIGTDVAAQSHVGSGGAAHANVVAGGAAGFMTGSDKTKLDGVATGATANTGDVVGPASSVDTILAAFSGTTGKLLASSGWATSGLLARSNHTGTQSADTLTDGTTNKAFLSTERTKLAGIATGATANQTDAYLLSRSNHTGSQAASTIAGTATNDSAGAGLIGEFVESVVPFASAVTLANATDKTVASISLTAGDWDVDALANFISDNTVAASRYLVSISNTNNTAAASGNTDHIFASFVNGGYAPGYPAMTKRISLSATTTIYLVVISGFTGGTMKAYGTIRARRVR